MYTRTSRSNRTIEEEKEHTTTSKRQNSDCSNRTIEEEKAKSSVKSSNRTFMELKLLQKKVEGFSGMF